MAFFRGVGNAFGTVGGVFAAPFDGGKLVRDQAEKCDKEWGTVGKDVEEGFYKDGCVTNFVEKNIPIGGYVTAAVHEAAGNNSHAKRAAARGTKATVQGVAIAAAVAFAPVTGGASIAAGAAAGAVGAAAGSGLQAAIETSYNNDDKERVGQETLKRKAEDWAIDIGVGAAQGAAAGAIKFGSAKLNGGGGGGGGDGGAAELTSDNLARLPQAPQVNHVPPPSSALSSMSTPEIASSAGSIASTIFPSGSRVLADCIGPR